MSRLLNGVVTQVRDGGGRRRGARFVGVAVLGVAMLLASCGGTSGTVTSSTTVPATSPPTSPRTSPATTVLPGSTLPPPTKTLLELAKIEGSLSTLLRLLDVAGLTSTLDGAGPFSLIAATDSAFAKIDAATLDKLTKDPALLKRVLEFGIVDKKIATTDITTGSVATLEGSPLTLKATNARFPTVNGVAVVKGARATNGTILVIDTLLVPPDITLS